MRELGSGIAYNTHNATSLIRTLKYVSDILQTEEAFTVEEYKHTHTHTRARIAREHVEHEAHRAQEYVGNEAREAPEHLRHEYVGHECT